MYPKIGYIPRGRPRLLTVLQGSGKFITAIDVMRNLGVGRIEAAHILARWNAQGWLKRVKRGIYVPVPIDMQADQQVLEDPWILVPCLFGDAYIGGWSAAEYWGLTEQIFRSISVFTTQIVRRKQVLIQDIPFMLRHIQPNTIFGLNTVWRGSTKVMVSSPARTIIDMLADPKIGGGIIHVSECLNTFLKMDNANPEELITLGDQLGNSVVFKRLGFLLELKAFDPVIVDACKQRISKGLTKLNPTVDCPKVLKRWNLRLPSTWRSNYD